MLLKPTLRIVVGLNRMNIHSSIWELDRALSKAFAGHPRPSGHIWLGLGVHPI